MEPNNPELLVAIGASAGGLEPLEGFFKTIPEDSNLAFFVIQHLSPDYKSLMNEILARHTSLKINKVEDAMPVEPNNIYLIPAKKEMVIQSGKLKLRDRSTQDQLNRPIDIFFESLALEAGEKGVGIILSGSGSDGARGVVDIHRAGGLVIVQDQQSAKFPSMPQSAVDSGSVDLELKVEEMYGVLEKYLDNPGNIKAVIPNARIETGEIADIIAMLREKYQIDFGLYKSGTINRRIERRMSLKQYIDISRYVDLLSQDEGELNALYKDLLIGVTAFFRDPEAFSAVEELFLPALLLRDDPDVEEVRVWSVGCATGEEVYSLAIMCCELLRQKKREANLKFFATDVHRESLNIAAQGIYDKDSLASLSPELLDRWFDEIDAGSFQINQELRRMIVFAEHDVLKDPPFTKIDLITCRNLLIYMRPEAQKKILSLFHFALRKNGRLFLGPSETLGELEQEFEIIDKHWKLFKKARDVRLPAHMRYQLASTLGVSNLIPGRGTGGNFQIDQRLLRAYDSILERHITTGFLVNQSYELLHSFGDSRQILIPPKGRATLDMLGMVEGELKIALAAAFQRAGRERKPVTYKGVNTNIFADSQQVSVIVEPLPDKVSDTLYYFVWFDPIVNTIEAETDSQTFDAGLESGERILELEQEVQNLKENLQATIEELETSNEELQASNEELVASNEELQSTNEELHSVNEELYTVNAEYETKIKELSQMTSDLDNLLDNTEVGTMFLDEKFCIRKYTQPITRVFNVLPHDLGRPIEHISNIVGFKSVLPTLEQVLSTGETYSQEFSDPEGIWYLMRVLPYRGENKAIRGIVITFFDITSQKSEEIERVKLTEQLHHAHKMRAIGTLAGGIAHEFNNLLQAISSQMELIIINENVSDEEKLSLMETMKMTGRAKELVKGILSFSHRSVAEKKHVDLNEITRNTLQMLEKTLPRNIILKAECTDNPVVIKAESSQVQQVLFNLATNSKDAMKDGGQLTFTTSIVQLDEKSSKQYPDLYPGSYAQLVVSDSGKGMAPEVASEIFNPFFTTKDIGEGTGIGLSIVYGIISSHHGYIECESKQDQGTQFTIFLPLAEHGTVAEKDENALISMESISLSKGSGATLLVVEDEAPIRKLCKKILEQAGFTVITAKDGEEALTIYREKHEQISLTIVDIGMPGMGGEKCINELKTINPDAKIIIASGYLNHAYAQDPQKYGAVKFISKPYQVSVLAQKVFESLENGS